MFHLYIRLEANKLYAPKSRENPHQKKQQNFIEQAARIVRIEANVIPKERKRRGILNGLYKKLLCLFAYQLEQQGNLCRRYQWFKLPDLWT